MNMRHVGDSDARSSLQVAGQVPAPRFSPAIIPGLLRLLDVLAISLSGIAASLVTDVGVGDNYVISFIFFLAAFTVIVGDKARIYSETRVMHPYQCLNDVAICIFSGTMFFMSIMFSLMVENVHAGYAMVFPFAAIMLIATTRIATFEALAFLSSRRIMGRRIAIVGTGSRLERFLDGLHDRRPHFIQVAGVYRIGQGGEGDVNALIAEVRAHRVDEIVIATAFDADETLQAHVERLRELPVDVHLAPDLHGFEGQVAFQPNIIAGQSVFELARKPLSGWGVVLKAAEDYIGAVALLLLLSPLMLMIAALIRIDSRGPVFFMQNRLGFNNQPFKIYKFRSMYVVEDDAGVRQARRGDPRVTRIGRFIRATSLDELPQLLNVLNGTMSLVGPRPHAISHNEEYGRQIRGYFARHKVKPGITGWAQVNGLRGETDTVEKMEARIRHDVYYAENWSIFFDIRILFSTVLTFLFQKTAY